MHTICHRNQYAYSMEKIVFPRSSFLIEIILNFLNKKYTMVYIICYGKSDLTPTSFRCERRLIKYNHYTFSYWSTFSLKNVSFKREEK